jgi:hypothetical protein
MSDQLKMEQTLKQGLDQLQSALNGYKGLDEVAKMTQDLLPKDKFTADIDSQKLEISIGMSGKAIVFNFDSESKCKELFNDLKEQKQGFFKRFFKS